MANFWPFKNIDHFKTNRQIFDHYKKILAIFWPNLKKKLILNKWLYLLCFCFRTAFPSLFPTWSKTPDNLIPSFFLISLRFSENIFLILEFFYSRIPARENQSARKKKWKAELSEIERISARIGFWALEFRMTSAIDALISNAKSKDDEVDTLR